MNTDLFNKERGAGRPEVGVDIVDIRRIRQSYEKYGEKFLQRVLTENEISYCRKKKDMMPSVAARFAAKEAVSKAIGSGISRGFSWKSVEVVNEEHGKPSLKVLNEAFGVSSERFRLSLSHSGDYAVAFVLLDT